MSEADRRYQAGVTGVAGHTVAASPRRDLVEVPQDIARKIKGPGMGLDEFVHAVRERRFAIDQERGIGTQRNKDVFLKELLVQMGQLAETFTVYKDRLQDGHEAATHWLVGLAAEASRFAEWDARAGKS